MTDDSPLSTAGIVFHHMGSRLGGFGTLPADTDLEQAAAWIDHCGIDAYNYGIVWDQPPPEGFADLAATLADHGVDTFVGLREMGGGEFRGGANDPSQRLCQADSDQLDTLASNVRGFLEGGSSGIIYLADDLNRREADDGSVVYTHCEDCDRAFDGEVAQAHVAVLERLVDLHREFDLETPLVFCPPFYNNTGRWDDELGRHRSYSVWPDDGPASRRTEQYFETTSAFTAAVDAIQYFVTRFEPDVLDRYRELGARPLTYWANVPRSIQYWRKRYGWPDVLPVYEGFDSLVTGWIKDYWWEDGRRTLAEESSAPNEVVRRTTSPDWPEIHDLAERVPSAWLCVHTRQPVSINTHEYPFRLWGLFCEDPDEFDPERAMRRVLGELFGTEAAPIVAEQNEAYQSALLAELARARSETDAEAVGAEAPAVPALQAQEAEIEALVTEQVSDLPLPAETYEDHFQIVRESLVDLEAAREA